MGAVLGFIVLLLCLWLLKRSIQEARGGAWTGPRTTGQRQRAGSGRRLAAPSPGRAAGAAGRAARSAGSAVLHPTSGTIRAQAKADAHRAWQEAFATDWIEQQRHNRANGTGGTATVTAAPPKRTLAQRIRLTPYTLPPEAPGDGGSNGQPANGTPTQPPAQGNGGPSARPSPPPAPAQPATNGGTTVAGASTAAAQKMIEGINEIQAHAAAGGIHAKREALAAIHEGAVRFTGMVQMIARQMSEPGQNYGHEITEPLAKAGQHFNAGAMTVSEADTALETLINMTVGDLAHSPRQAPHHRELSENGAR